MQHRNAQHGQQRSGWGIVWVDGRRDPYEGHLAYDGRAVTLEAGWLRVITGPHSAPQVSHRGPVSRTWPIGRVEIHWRLDEEAA